MSCIHVHMSWHELVLDTAGLVGAKTAVLRSVAFVGVCYAHPCVYIIFVDL